MNNYIEFDNEEVVCPFCFINLVHVIKESNVLLLDNNGIPVDQNTDYEDKVICPKCKEEFKFRTECGFKIRLGEQDPHNELSRKYNVSHNNSNGFGYCKEEE